VLGLASKKTRPSRQGRSKHSVRDIQCELTGTSNDRSSLRDGPLLKYKSRYFVPGIQALRTWLLSFCPWRDGCVFWDANSVLRTEPLSFCPWCWWDVSVFWMQTQHFVLGYFHSVPAGTAASFGMQTQYFVLSHFHSAPGGTFPCFGCKPSTSY
jgi:hypothetical protein